MRVRIDRSRISDEFYISSGHGVEMTTSDDFNQNRDSRLIGRSDSGPHRPIFFAVRGNVISTRNNYARTRIPDSKVITIHDRVHVDISVLEALITTLTQDFYNLFKVIYLKNVIEKSNSPVVLFWRNDHFRPFIS